MLRTGASPALVCLRRLTMVPIFLYDAMSAEAFEMILAGAVVTVLVWIFWKKGKSD